MKKIKVALIEDDDLQRHVFYSILRNQKDFELAFIAEGPYKAFDIFENNIPDVIFVDIEMPEMNGFIFSENILKEYCNCKIIFLSSHDNLSYIRKALKVNASGYIFKPAGVQEIRTAVKEAIAGKHYFSQNIRDIMDRDYKKLLSEENNGNGKLSLREKEILQLLVEEKSYKEIASLLNISTRTVRVHKKNVLQKTGSSTLAGLMKYAIKENIIPL